ncbi:hypothetical protein [Streptomyces bobili]|uniref:hypothetical protein n=1 Tax=Streptomyces bobili TaxID=67280 RepID=UPI0037B0DD71
MSARDVLETNIDPAVPEDMARRSIDQFAAEVLAEVDQALAGMQLPEYLKGTFNAGSYADAWRHCRSIVQAMAHQTEGQTTRPVAEAYDGELEMLRGLVRTLRVVARQSDLGEVQRLLIHHAVDDAAAREEKATATAAPATPDFFQPDRTYQRRRWLFHCLAVAPDPFNGETRAVGFLHRLGEPATATGLTPDDWAHGEWTPTDTATTGKDGAL